MFHVHIGSRLSRVINLCLKQTFPFFFSLLFILALAGELANLRRDKGQMDFGALDYSNDEEERSGREVLLGWLAIHSLTSQYL